MPGAPSESEASALYSRAKTYLSQSAKLPVPQLDWRDEGVSSPGTVSGLLPLRQAPRLWHVPTLLSNTVTLWFRPLTDEK